MSLTYGRLFAALNRTPGSYVVVGGLAVVLHGHTRLTTDTDLVVDLATAPVRQLLVTLEALGFQPRVPVSIMDFADPGKRREWIREKHMQVFSLFHPDHPRWVIDLFADSPIPFDELSARAVLKTVEDVDVPVASIGDLIRMKQSTGRDVDRDDIEYLTRIREMRAEYRA